MLVIYNKIMETYKLYDNKIELLFDDKKHIYMVGDKVIYGATSIIGVLDKPAILYWAVNQSVEYVKANLKPGEALDEVQIGNLLDGAKNAHRVKKTTAGDIGSLIHEYLDNWIKAKIEKKPLPKPPINKEMKNAIKGFFDWAVKNKIKLIASEQKCYSKKFGYAGTYDLEANIGGKKTIIDFKSSNAVYPEMFLQAAAYLQAKEEEFGSKYDGGVCILRLSKEDKEKNIAPFEIKCVGRKECDILIKVFLSCLEIYKWKMANKKAEIINNNHK